MKVSRMCWALFLLYSSFAIAHAGRERPAYAGVRLGQTQAEVRYMLGYPPTVIGNKVVSWDQFGGLPVYITDGSDPKNGLPKGMKFDDFLEWSYPRKESRIDVYFSEIDKTVE